MGSHYERKREVSSAVEVQLKMWIVGLFDTRITKHSNGIVYSMDVSHNFIYMIIPDTLKQAFDVYV